MANLESDEEVIKNLLQTVAWNDLKGFLYWLAYKPDCVDGVGVWNGRVMTPLMVAAAYCRDEAVMHILHWSSADVNRRCGPEGATALHCAASSGLTNAGAVVTQLLNAGANPNLADANGLLPRDAAVLSPARPSTMQNLKRVLDFAGSPHGINEFLMQTYKVLPCSDVREMHCLEREECGKYHPGADDRRRSPLVYDYSSKSCLDYIRGIRACPNGDSCRFAHGPWEAGFHPHHYKTMMCGNGGNCNWRLCEFAHSQGALRQPPSASPSHEQQQQQVQERRFMNAVRSYHGNVVESVHLSSSAPATGWSQSHRSDQTTITVNREDDQPLDQSPNSHSIANN